MYFFDEFRMLPLFFGTRNRFRTINGALLTSTFPFQPLVPLPVWVWRSRRSLAREGGADPSSGRSAVWALDGRGRPALPGCSTNDVSSPTTFLT